MKFDTEGTEASRRDTEPGIGVNATAVFTQQVNPNFPKRTPESFSVNSCLCSVTSVTRSIGGIWVHIAVTTMGSSAAGDYGELPDRALVRTGGRALLPAMLLSRVPVPERIPRARVPALRATSGRHGDARSGRINDFIAGVPRQPPVPQRPEPNCHLLGDN